MEIELIVAVHEVLAFFIEPTPHETKPDMSLWTNAQNLAFENSIQSNIRLERYVLEAQRLKVDLPLIRKFVPRVATDTFEVKIENAVPGRETKTRTLRNGDKILLRMICQQVTLIYNREGSDWWIRNKHRRTRRSFQIRPSLAYFRTSVLSLII